jgi:hypothetical protein
MQTVTTIGLDIAKSVFQMHGVDVTGQVVIRRQLKRRYVLGGTFAAFDVTERRYIPLAAPRLRYDNCMGVCSGDVAYWHVTPGPMAVPIDVIGMKADTAQAWQNGVDDPFRPSSASNSCCAK